MITAIIVFIIVYNIKYKKLTKEIQSSLGLMQWLYLDIDEIVQLKSSKAVNDYVPEKMFMGNKDKLLQVSRALEQKLLYSEKLSHFLVQNEFMERFTYKKVRKDIERNLEHCRTYDVKIKYVSPAGNKTNEKTIKYQKQYLDHLLAHPELIMTKGEYNKYVKEQQKALLDEKHHKYYDKVNSMTDLAVEASDKLVIKGDQQEVDSLIANLFDRTVNSIKKIKSVDSEEWDLIDKVISTTEQGLCEILNRNKRILDYYESPEFIQIKTTCDSLMESQKEFNEYINEKAQTIATLFGTRVVREETVAEDKHEYIRPYKKSVTPFTAEVSAQVFASAENNPLEYVVKQFYPNKSQYPEQIQKLQLLVEELETLKDAKRIIDDYKKDYQQYITSVPDYVMENDEDGFYSRLGFANISESALTVSYKFSYTSGGGFAQRSFSVPMTEETIISLIETLQGKLSAAAFSKEQRALMTGKLRQQIKERDNYTCKYCGNSTMKEPNLLLEIDHIIPVAKGGCTVEDNLQTLCWKCNRSKGSKLV